MVVLCVGVIALGGLLLLRPSRTARPQTGPVQETETTAASFRSSPASRRRGPTAWPASETPLPSGPRIVISPAPPQEPSPETRQLVNSLAQIQMTNGVLSEEQAAQFQMNLGRLAGYGASAIPAIREFLARNTDLDLGEAGKSSVGYATARLALLDVAARLGGPEAMSALSEVLQVTGDPREIGTIAHYLEQLEPGSHRQESLEAARQALDMATQGNLPGRDVAPLFELFKNYGDGSLAPELARNADQWGYYSMFALAQLPEGAGIPTLIQIVSGEGSTTSSARNPALASLAQAAGDSDLARSALVEQARQNKLTEYNWASLQSFLAGDVIRFQDTVADPGIPAAEPADQQRTHINSGNQNFYTGAPATPLTPEQIRNRSALIEELISVTTDPAGQQALQRAKADLEHRLLPIAGTQSPNP